MSTIRYQIVHYRYQSRPASRNLLTAAELARLARLHPEMLDCFVDWGLVDPAESEPELLFSETAVPRIWRIMRLRAGIGVVLDLLDKIDHLEREIAWLRKQA